MSRVVFVGEAWGRDEASAGRPFVGATGRELCALCADAGFFDQADANRMIQLLWAATNTSDESARRRMYDERDDFFRGHGIFLTNVLNLQPPGNRVEDLCGPRWGSRPAIRAGKYLRPEFSPELERLQRELAEENPNIIIGLGATALWFHLNTGAISKHRGTVAQSPYGKFLPTFHPAYLMRGAWDQRGIVVFDLIKARRESAYSDVRRPARFVYVPETLQDFDEVFGRNLSNASRLSIDIETAADQITCIGFAWSASETFVVPIFDNRKASRSYWSESDEPFVWQWIKRICGLPMPKVFQNGLYDLHFLWRRYGIAVANCQDDTMLLHHALYPELQKGLGFLGSLYTSEPAWKTMRPKGKGATLKDLKEE